MQYLNEDFFSAMKKNGERYLKQKEYFFVNVLPRVMALVNKEVLMPFKINLADNILDEPMWFDFKVGNIIEYDGHAYFYRIIKEEGQPATYETDLDRLISVLSDKKFLYLQQTISEFFENLNAKYIKGAERAYKSNKRLDEMFGVISRGVELTTDWLTERDSAACICQTITH